MWAQSSSVLVLWRPLELQQLARQRPIVPKARSTQSELSRQLRSSGVGRHAADAPCKRASCDPFDHFNRYFRDPLTVWQRQRPSLSTSMFLLGHLAR